MDQSNISNKMKQLETCTKVVFKVAMHGKLKDEEVNYKNSPHKLKTLIRRRLADNDGSIEIIGVEPKKNMGSKTTKKSNQSTSNKKIPSDGAVDSDSNNGDN